MARSFNGTTQFAATSGNPASLDFTNNSVFSIECWANVNAFPGGASVIGTKGYDGTNVGYQLAFAGTGNVLLCGCFKTSDGTHAAQWTYSGWSTGTWVHLYGDYDGSAWHVYWNASLKATSIDGTGPVHTTQPFVVGAQTDGVGGHIQFCNVKVANLTVRSVVLSAGEITALANGANTRFIRPLSIKGYFPLFGLSSPEPDFSGNLNNLVLTNSPTAVNHAPVTLWTRRSAGFPLFQAPTGRRNRPPFQYWAA